jgi:multidrug efflux pump subunit AcrB
VIVRLALPRPYTLVVVSILILIMGMLAIVRIPTEIISNIDIPVISFIWNSNGLVPEDISDRLVSVTERALTTSVDNIEHIESQSLYGVAVVKVFLEPTANVRLSDNSDSLVGPGLLSQRRLEHRCGHSYDSFHRSTSHGQLHSPALGSVS